MKLVFLAVYSVADCSLMMKPFFNIIVKLNEHVFMFEFFSRFVSFLKVQLKLKSRCEII